MSKEMPIHYIHHITSIDRLERRLEQGLKSTSAYDILGPAYEDDQEQHIFFDYIGTNIAEDGAEQIVHSFAGSATAAARDVENQCVLVLDYQKIRSDFLADRTDIYSIDIYYDFRRYDDRTPTLWEQSLEQSERLIPSTAEGAQELILSFGNRTTFFDIKPYLVSVYAVAHRVQEVSAILKRFRGRGQVSRSVKVYTRVSAQDAQAIASNCSDPSLTKENILSYIDRYSLPRSGRKVDLCVRLYQLVLMAGLF